MGTEVPGMARGVIYDAFTTERHYADHLLPVWNALEQHERGIWYTGGAGEALCARIKGRAPHVFTVPTDPPDGTEPTLTASHNDLRYTPRNRPVIYLEHGAGQTYLGVEHGGYSGGEGRERVVLFLCPNERVVGLNRARYPETPAVAVGCPRLDAYRGPWWREPCGPGRPVVAFSCHWDCQIVPETRTAFWEFAPGLPALQERYEVLGHGHPKALESFRGTYDTLGIEVVDDFDDVLARADCYICDNSSTQFEWCAVADRPMVSLRPSFYRREVEHGLRFYEAEPHPVCKSPDALPTSVALALQDKDRHRIFRSHCAQAAYGQLVDGHASQRAVAAIRAFT